MTIHVVKRNKKYGNCWNDNGFPLKCKINDLKGDDNPQHPQSVTWNYRAVFSAFLIT